jgi:hypothetical protein
VLHSARAVASNGQVLCPFRAGAVAVAHMHAQHVIKGTWHLSPSDGVGLPALVAQATQPQAVVTGQALSPAGTNRLYGQRPGPLHRQGT